MANIFVERLKRNIQLYQLLKGNSALARSLIIRLVLGALGGLPIISLALFTAFDRIFFSITDLWLSRKTSDADSLARIGLLGLFFKIFSDAILLSVFFLKTPDSIVTPIILALAGSLLGVGQAFTQGNIEDFYQRFSTEYLKTIKNKAIMHHQQSKPFRYWLWWLILNLVSLASIISLSYFLYNFYRIELLLLFTILQNTLLIWKISKDQKKFFNVHPENTVCRPNNSSIVTAQNVFLAIINSLSMLCLMTSCYFMFIAICLNESVTTQFNLWAVILMFVLGYEYLGSLLVQWLAPKISKNHKVSLLIGASVIVITSLLFQRFQSHNLDFFPSVMTYLLFLVYPLFMSFGLKLIGAVSLKQIHKSSLMKSKELAYSTFPGHMLMAMYCLYLVFNGTGIPSLTQSLNFSQKLSFLIFMLICMYLFLQVKPKTKTNPT